MEAFYRKRREKLKSVMVDGDVVILISKDEMKRSNDTSYKYRQDSNYFYMTGMAEHDKTAWVMVKKGEKVVTTVYLEEPSAKKLLWDGQTISLDTYQKGEDVSFVKGMLKRDVDLKKLIKTGVRILSQKGEIESLAGVKFKNIDPLIKEMRLIKEDVELSAIKEACDITAKMFKKLQKKKNKFKNERDIEAFVSSEFIKNSATESYLTIVASGNNANILHYGKNNSTLKGVGLVLVDAGCEHNMYASDVSRTLILNSATEFQREIYEIVLMAQVQTLLMIKPGVFLRELKEFAEAVMAHELMARGIISDLKTMVEIFPHGIGHYIGLDVHDPCPYKDVNEKEIPLRENMVITIEPGLYIARDQLGVKEEYRGIGVRIEDVVHVIEDGASILTKKIKK